MKINAINNLLTVFNNLPGLFIILEPNSPLFTVTAISNAYLKATHTKREALINKGFFEVFRSNPKDPKETSVALFKHSFAYVLEHKMPHEMQVQRFEIPEGHSHHLIERFWKPINTPVLDEEGNLIAIIHSIEDVTESLEAQKMGLFFMDKFLSVADNAITGFVLTSEDHRILEINAYFCQLLGYSEAELLAMQWNEIIDYNSIELELLPEGENATTAKRGEAMAKKKNGTWIYIEYSSSHFRDEYRNAKRTSWMITDISERKEKETALHQLLLESHFNSELLQHVIGSIKDGFIALDKNWVCIYANENVAAYFGNKPATELLQKVIWFNQDPLAMPGLKTSCELVMHSRQALIKTELYPLLGKYIEYRIYPSADEGVAIFFADRTEQIEAANKIQENEYLLNAMIQSMDEGVALVNLSGEVLLYNPALEKMLGLPPQDSATKDWSNIYHICNPNTRDIIPPNELPIVKAMTGVVTINEEFLILNPVQGDVFIKCSAFPLKDSKGNVIGGMSVQKDITESKITALALKKSAEQYGSLFLDSPQPMWIVNYDTKQFVEVNNAAIRHYGYSKEEFLSMTIKDIRPPEDVEKIYNLERIKEGGSSVYHGIWKHFKKDGTLITVEITSHLIDYNDQTCTLVLVNDISNKLMAEWEKERERINKEALINNTKDTIWSVAADFTLIAANKVFIDKYHSYSGVYLKEGDSLLGGKWFNHSLVDFWRSNYQRAFKGESFTVENPSPKIEGMAESWSLVNFTPIFDADKIIGVACHATDITERINTEKIIRYEKELSDNIINSLPGVFYLYDSEGHFIRWNKNFENVTGYSAAEISTMQPYDFYDAEERERIKHRIKKVFENKEPGIEVELLTKHNTKIPYFINSHTIEYNGNKCLMGIGIDITESKKAAYEIHLSNERYDLLTKATNDCIWDWDLITGKVFRPGRKLEVLLGWATQSEEEVDAFWNAHAHADDWADVNRNRNAILANKEKNYWENEYRFLKPDASYAFVYDRGYIIRNQEGKAIRIIGASQDISARKASENLLLELNKTLEKRAQELAESNVELQRFGYIVSHDLQEPLRMVYSFMELLKQQYADKLDEKAKQYIYYATDGAIRMKKLIMDLLEYSRIGTNKEQLAMVDLNEVVESIRQVFEPSIQSQNITLLVHPLPKVTGIQSQLEQLMQNLMGNAIKYKSKKELVIEIGCTEKPEMWEIYVQDNGIGIPSKFFEKIFVVFQRLHTEATYPGTGIGLAICKKIVQRHYGQIWVNSQVGQGSTFYFTLPKKFPAQ